MGIIDGINTLLNNIESMARTVNGLGEWANDFPRYLQNILEQINNIYIQPALNLIKGIGAIYALLFLIMFVLLIVITVRLKRIEKKIDAQNNNNLL